MCRATLIAPCSVKSRTAASNQQQASRMRADLVLVNVDLDENAVRVCIRHLCKLRGDSLAWPAPRRGKVNDDELRIRARVSSGVQKVRRRQRHLRRVWSATGPQRAPPTHAQVFQDGAHTRAHELNVQAADTTRHAAQCTLLPAPARTASNSALVGICLTMVLGCCCLLFRLARPLQVRGSCR